MKNYDAVGEEKTAEGILTLYKTVLAIQVCGIGG